MGRRSRTLFGLVLVGCGAVALYLWRNRRHARDYAKAILAPASDCLRDLVRNAFRNQAICVKEKSRPKQEVTGLAAPEARPLSCVDQFLSWSPNSAADLDVPFCQTYNAPIMLPSTTSTTLNIEAPASLPQAAVTMTRTETASTRDTGGSGGVGGGVGCWGRPRLLVCHDMMRGYLEDRLVQGSANPGFFRLWQWDQIDVFIYFSHHLVTLPPPGWISAAHRNGVRVLGTFITEEWEDGRLCCETLLASPAAARHAADILTSLAAYHGFEGWLVNVENGLRRELVPNLITFLGHLRARMAAVVGPHSLVVWYDAVTADGRLAWQNDLTPLNAPFFDAADALFVNYTWSEAAPAAVAASAGSRSADVFMGVDVFGRGSYGGGKDNCQVALSAARSEGLSAALFAPGWVYEEFPRDSFEQRQEAFWAKIRAVWPPRPALLQRLPLVTCFNCGAGRAVWLGGRRVSSAPWFNLAAQDVVAATTALQAETDGPGKVGVIGSSPAGPPQLRVRPTQQVAFCGGCCLALQLGPAEETEGEGEGEGEGAARMGPWKHELYSAHLVVPAAGLDLTYTVACSGASRVAVLLRTAPMEFTAAPAAAAAAWRTPRVGGVVVGPWGAGDRAVVEALQRAGYSCITCQAQPAGTTTCPLPEVGATATTPATAATSVPAGLPWVTCTAHLPYSLVTSSPADCGAGAVITAVGVVCYRTASAAGSGGAAVPAATSAVASGGGSAAASVGGGRSSARGSTTGSTGPVISVAPASADGNELVGEAVTYQTFLGRLVIGEHLTASGRQGPAAVTEDPSAAADPQVMAAAAAAAGSLGLPLAAPLLPVLAGPSQLSGASCFRVRWSRPGGSRPRSLRTESSISDPRVSGELVESSQGDDDNDEDEDWERSSSGGGGGATAGGSPVKVTAPPVDGGEGIVAVGGGASGDVDVDGARLLTCELSWEPQFEACGTPRHRSYHVWAHFSTVEAPAAPTMSPSHAAGKPGGVSQPPQVLSAVASTIASPGSGASRSVGPGGEDREGAWEVGVPFSRGSLGDLGLGCARFLQP
ncbi:hypothetical protein VaNZ11_004267, partial [Volvox africanus]